MIEWITDNNIMKEQVISINAAETSVHDADAVLVLTFKKDQEPTYGPLTGLQYYLVKNTIDWDTQYQEITQIAKNNAEVIALSHTARNIGQINI